MFKMNQEVRIRNGFEKEYIWFEKNLRSSSSKISKSLEIINISNKMNQLILVLMIEIRIFDARWYLSL